MTSAGDHWRADLITGRVTIEVDLHSYRAQVKRERKDRRVDGSVVARR